MKNGMAEVMCPTKYGEETLTAWGAMVSMISEITSASFFMGVCAISDDVNREASS
jgi:hypothetical protein